MRTGHRHADGERAGPVRPPAVAGQFYPADPADLAATVDRLVDAVAVPGDEPLAAAYVVPHAGYRYSGPTAAYVYARLRAHAAEVTRVVLIGPAHRTPLRGCAVPTTARWRTPLGEVPVDPGVGVLVADGHAVADDGPHAPERIGARDACGVFALRGLVGWARHQRYPPRVLHLATSADSGAPADRVVGYPAFAFG